MEILIKILTFCGIVGAMIIVVAIATEILIRYYPQIIQKILGE